MEDMSNFITSLAFLWLKITNKQSITEVNNEKTFVK